MRTGRELALTPRWRRMLRRARVSASEGRLAVAKLRGGLSRNHVWRHTPRACLSRWGVALDTHIDWWSSLDSNITSWPSNPNPLAVITTTNYWALRPLRCHVLIAGSRPSCKSNCGLRRGLHLWYLVRNIHDTGTCSKRHSRLQSRLWCCYAQSGCSRSSDLRRLCLRWCYLDFGCLLICNWCWLVIFWVALEIMRVRRSLASNTVLNNVC